MMNKPWQEPHRQSSSVCIEHGRLLSVDDSQPTQRVVMDLLVDEQRRVKRFQPYGMTTHPPLKGKPFDPSLMLMFGPTRSDGVAILVGDRTYRIKNLIEGEVCIYDDLENFIHLRRNKIEVKSKDEVEVNAPVVDINAANQVTVNAGSTISEVAGSSITESAPTITINGSSRVRIQAPLVTIEGSSETIRVP